MVMTSWWQEYNGMVATRDHKKETEQTSNHSNKYPLRFKSIIINLIITTTIIMGEIGQAVGGDKGAAVGAKVGGIAGAAAGGAAGATVGGAMGGPGGAAVGAAIGAAATYAGEAAGAPPK
eukprot:TRINITY_DN224_c0_g1_i2.p1 TRINITY_DN224_c0_g1~~TRINITY_DN224_c0_g1_i2.p1  ORF type:complete len:120 (+),score=37.26 TRINITY_DN224_c0_g1_i2:63-422(+)